jgi:hypothetical protein
MDENQLNCLFKKKKEVRKHSKKKGLKNNNKQNNVLKDGKDESDERKCRE